MLNTARFLISSLHRAKDIKSVFEISRKNSLRVITELNACNSRRHDYIFEETLITLLNLMTHGFFLFCHARTARSHSDLRRYEFNN
jgi:hypothetical protein